MTPRTDTVAASHLLCDHDQIPAPQRQQLDGAFIRALGLRSNDPDFAATVAAGYVEPLDEWADRVLGGTP